MGEFSAKGLYHCLKMLPTLDTQDPLFEQQKACFIFTRHGNFQKSMIIHATEQDNSGQSIHCDGIQESTQSLFHLRLQQFLTS